MQSGFLFLWSLITYFAFDFIVTINSFMMKKQFLILVCVFNIFYISSQVNGSFLDKRNNKNYKTVVIGNQTWLAENLNVTKFRNGDPIPQVMTDEEWEKAGKEGKPAWCYYDGAKSNLKKYGVLYNFHAVSDPRGIAPEGWHVPSKEEWQSLIKELGGEEIAGEKLKSKTGWTDYLDPVEINGQYVDQYKPGNGTDEFGFNALPGSYRFWPGFYGYCGSGEAWAGPCGLLHDGFWWSNTQVKDNYNGEMVILNLGLEHIRKGVSLGLSNVGDGLYLRCIKD